MAEGYDVELAKKPDSLLQTDCVICHLVLQNPCETTCCGVYFCKGCLEKQRRYRGSCPYCRKNLDWQVSQAHERYIKQLKVVCKHKDRGCEWVGELGQLQTHLKEKLVGDADKDCKFVLLECTSCHEYVPRATFTQHKAEECPNRKRACPMRDKGCTWRGQLGAIANHLNENPLLAKRLLGCGFVKLNCTYCHQCFERRGLEQHEAQCQLEEIECEFKVLGCEAMLARKDMPAHLSMNDTHMKHLRQACVRLRHENADRNSEIEKLQQANTDCNSEIERLQQENRHSISEIKKLHALCHSLQSQMKRLLFMLVFVSIAFCLLFCVLFSVPESQKGEDPVSTMQSQVLSKSHYSMSLYWPEDNFTLHLELSCIRDNCSCIQFRTSETYHLLKANVSIGRQHFFNVEFSELESQGAVSGYQSLQNANFFKEGRFQFRVLRLDMEEKYLFALCNLQLSETLMPSMRLESRYGTVMVNLTLKELGDQLFVYLSVDHLRLTDMLDRITFSFSLLSGQVLNCSFSNSTSKNKYRCCAWPYIKFLQELFGNDSCLTFKMVWVEKDFSESPTSSQNLLQKNEKPTSIQSSIDLVKLEATIPASEPSPATKPMGDSSRNSNRDQSAVDYQQVLNSIVPDERRGHGELPLKSGEAPTCPKSTLPPPNTCLDEQDGPENSNRPPHSSQLQTRDYAMSLLRPSTPTPQDEAMQLVAFFIYIFGGIFGIILCFYLLLT